MRYLLLLLCVGCFHDVTAPKAKWQAPTCPPGEVVADTLWMHGSMEGQYALLCAHIPH